MEQKLNDAINLIYISAADPSGWPHALAAISELFGHSAVGINHQNFSQAAISWALHHEYDVDSLRSHFEEFNRPDNNPGLKALLSATPLEPFTISSFLSPQEFYADDSVNACLVEQNLHHGLLNVVDKDEANTSMLLYRGRSGGDFTEKESRMSGVLGRHVRNAVRLAHSNILKSLHENYQNSVATEHRFGTIFLSSKGAVLDADAFARRAMERSRALKLVHGKLTIMTQARSTGATSLSEILAAPALTSHVVQDGPASFIVLKKLPPPFINTALFIPSAYSAIAIRRVELEHVDVGTPQQVFGLTKTEAAVCRHLCLGATQADIAAELSVSSNTVKTHLRSIFAKTDSHRQSELVARLLKLAD